MVNTTFLPERVGGAELHTLWLAQELNRKGHEVSVVCKGPDDTNARNEVEISNEQFQAVPVVRLRFPLSHGVGSWGVHEAVNSWASNFLQKERPDVLHFGLFWDLVGVANAAKQLEIPYTVTAHLYSLFCYNGFLLMPRGKTCDGLAERAKCRLCLKRSWSHRHRVCAWLARAFPEQFRAKWEQQLPVARGLRGVEEVFSSGRDFARQASLLVAPTEFVRRELLKNGFEAYKIVVIPYGLPPYIFEYAKQELGDKAVKSQSDHGRPFQFTVISRLSPEKGLATLIAAFRSVVNGASAQLNIYGDGPADYVSNLKYLANPDKRVRFCGPTSHEKIPEILQRADAVVVPSEWKEVSGISAREALALGIPVIASDIGGLPEAVRHNENGLLVRPGDPEGLSGALRRCLKRQAPFKPLPQELRGTVTVEENASMTLSAFKSLSRLH